MKKPWWFAVVALFAVFTAIPAQAAVVEKVVAVVNNRIVTLSELNQELEEVVVNPEAEVNVREVLDAMIDRILLDQQAAARKISVSDEEVRAIVKSQQEALNLDEGAIAEELKKQNMTEELFYRQWKYQILSRRLLDLVTQRSIAVTDEEIEEYHREHYEEGGSSTYGRQTKIAHILIIRKRKTPSPKRKKCWNLQNLVSPLGNWPESTRWMNHRRKAADCWDISSRET